ncbi:NACHT, LRR and PYD domains-containing protein 3-like isoform X2 [Pyxicephalus adspersus]|uniref:NACHT, LRR and PYD domains-containing protein 3-like isoform X2 n=1 Tax=Pyxicephalus adspersus TaxID=30357 RepID=UPI003B5986D2
MASSMGHSPAPEDVGVSLTISDLLLASLEDLNSNDFERFRDKLSDFSYKDISPVPRSRLENVNRVATKNLLISFYGEAAAVEVTIKVLKSIFLMGSAEELQMKIRQHGVIKAKSSDNRIVDYRTRYMTLMKERYQSHKDGNASLGQTVHLDKRYTKLLIIKKQRNLKEREHEIISLGKRHLKIMDERSSSQYSPVTIDGLFDPDEDGIVPKVVLLQGPAGIGKTMTSQKIMLEWASGNLYQDKFDFVFYLSCRELNTLGDQISLAGLVQKLCHMKCERDLLKSIFCNPQKILFLVDGFDELKWNLVSGKEVYEDPFQETSKKILLNGIFRQSCFCGSSLIITTRPYSLEQLNELFQCPRYVEILGFTGSDREQFFYCFFPEKEQADLALNIVKDNDTLFTMCAIPITCWIVCTVIKQQMAEGQNEIECKTTTSIYLLYLKSLLKYHCRNSKQSVMKCIKKICKLANEGVWNQKILFCEDDLRRHKLSITDIESVFLNENIFQRDVETQTCYSFIHLTVQEFFAALYYVLGNKMVITSMTPAKNVHLKELLKNHKYKSHLQLTIQFLFGLFGEKQQRETIKLLSCKQISSKEKSVLVDWLIMNPNYQMSFKYLYESQDENLVGKIMAYIPEVEVDNPGQSFDYKSISYCLKNSRCEHQINFINSHIGPKTRALLSSALPKCAQVRFSHCLFLQNEEKIPYNNSNASLEGLFNGQHGIQKLVLNNCSLKSYCCEDLSSVLTNQSLVKLDLSNNNLQDLGIKLLCKWLKQKDCILEELSLKECGLTSHCCADLCSFITTHQTLTMLDLSKNSLDDSGLKILHEGLKHSGCTLQNLRLMDCGLSPSCCKDLSNILTATRSVKSMDLSMNNLQDSGIKHLCRGLQYPECVLQELRLWYCGLTLSCCVDLRTVVIMNRTLNTLLLKGNNLTDSGMRLLCEGLKHPGCTLQELSIHSCSLTHLSCDDLRSVLNTNRSLTKLDLSQNSLQDSGVKILCEGLRDPGCTLQELCLKACGLSSYCCDDICSVIATNRTLIALDLTGNELKHCGKNVLYKALERYPDCSLQDLWVDGEGIRSNLVCEFKKKKPKKTLFLKWLLTNKPGNVQKTFTPNTSPQ